MRKFPEGAKLGSYYVTKEIDEGRVCFKIRQQVTLPNGKRVMARLPANKYQHIAKNRAALQSFVDKLNYGLDLKKKKFEEIKSAFIPQQLMDSFYAQLKNEIPNEKDRRYLFNTLLKKYFLDFFVNQLGILDPKEWVKRQAEWGVALTGKADDPKLNIFLDEEGKPRQVSAKTIKGTIQIANRFMAFLKIQQPEEYPLDLVFQPFSTEALKTYSAQNPQEEVGKFIPEADWKKIDEKLPHQIGSFIRLMYYYGLRRSESLGFRDAGAIRKGHLVVSQQLKSFSGDPDSDYEILKDKEQRNTPHWFCKASECYRLVTTGLNKKMHPDTLSERWDEFMLALGMDYKLHDFRRTFITRALRLYPHRDVQLAVGHANIATTMGYAQDDRNLDDEIWTPDSA